MIRVLHEKQTAAPTPSDLVFADEGPSVDCVVSTSRMLIQVSNKLLNIGPGVAAVDVDTPLCRRGFLVRGVLIAGRRVRFIVFSLRQLEDIYISVLFISI